MGPVITSSAGRNFAAEFRIDGGDHLFEPIHQLTISPKGWIAIPQTQSRTLRIFDSVGVFVERVGREGSGPGEFQQITDLGWTGDTLWVWDGRVRRLTLYGPRFDAVRTISIPRQLRRAEHVPPLAFGATDVRAVLPDGRLLVSGRPPSPNPSPYEEYGGRLAFLRVFRGTDEIRDIVDWAPRDESVTGYVSPDGQSGWGFRMPYYPQPLDDVSDDGSHFGIAKAFVDGDRAGTFEVRARSAVGITLFAGDYPFDGIPLTDEIMDELRELVRARASVSRERAAALDTVTYPRVFPPTTELLVGNMGEVWIQMETAGDSLRWLHLDQTGAPVDTITGPSNLRLLAADESRMWFVVTDEWEVPSIVRYRAVEHPG